MKPLSESFFSRSTLQAAQSLLGKYLVKETKEGRICGRIVETEAYLKDDPASHSYLGKTKRNSAMFGAPGTAYVYFTYGMYHCFNVVTNKEGIGEAVLVRALEPVEGINIMMGNRGMSNQKGLCNGPAKLVMALGINMESNGADLRKVPLYLASGRRQGMVECGVRIGISKGAELPYRYYIKNNPYVSR